MSSKNREIRHFHVVVVQKRAKKCTKKRDVRASCCFAYKIASMSISGKNSGRLISKAFIIIIP